MHDLSLYQDLKRSTLSIYVPCTLGTLAQITTKIGAAGQGADP